MSRILLIRVLLPAVSSLHGLFSSRDTSSTILLPHVLKCDEDLTLMDFRQNRHSPQSSCRSQEKARPEFHIPSRPGLVCVHSCMQDQARRFQMIRTSNGGHWYGNVSDASPPYYEFTPTSCRYTQRSLTINHQSCKTFKGLVRTFGHLL
jgi:hypothetical protein